MRSSHYPNTEDQPSVRASTERGKNRFSTSHGGKGGTGTFSKEHTFPITPKRLDIESVVAQNKKQSYYTGAKGGPNAAAINYMDPKTERMEQNFTPLRGL